MLMLKIWLLKLQFPSQIQETQEPIVASRVEQRICCHKSVGKDPHQRKSMGFKLGPPQMRHPSVGNISLGERKTFLVNRRNHAIYITLLLSIYIPGFKQRKIMGIAGAKYMFSLSPSPCMEKYSYREQI